VHDQQAAWQGGHRRNTPRTRGIRKPAGRHDGKAISLGELIHERVRRAIETAVAEELVAALGAAAYERTEARRGYRNGQKARTPTGPTGPLALTLPRGVVFTAAGGATEWRSAILPRYQRRVREVNEAVIATYLAGGQHPPDPRRLGPPPQGGSALEECGFAHRGDAP